MTIHTSDAVQAGMILGCGAALAVAGSTLHQHRGEVTGFGVEGLLGAGLAALGLGVVAAWLLTLALALTTELLARRGRFRTAQVLACFTPALMRRLAVAVLGINLLAAPAMAHAAPATSWAMASGSAGVPAVVETVPGRTGLRTGPTDSTFHPPSTAAAFTAATTASAAKEQETPISPAWRPAPLPTDGGLLLRQETRTERQAEEIVVAPGDSLWSIVGGRLGPLATAADIADAWPAWFEANRTTIGDDPSLLIPGQVLTAPPG